MNSMTGDFSNVAKPPESVTYFRNALTTVKKQPARRRIIIQPLPVSEIRRELEEPEESTTDGENDKENKSDLQTSFDLNFAAMSLTTPAKNPFKSRTYVTPQASSKIMNRKLDYHYITPLNKIPPRVQCSVNMQNYIKTPLSKLVEETTEEQEIKAPLTPNFKKLKVNGVDYIVLNTLGKGGSSEVFHCYNSKTETHRAVKCVSLDNKISATGFINEVKILRTLQKCDRIIKMFDYEIKEDEKILWVVMEVGGLDLSKILKESALSTNHMQIYMLLYYWMEMLYAVKQIHSHGIVHSDLKPANFLKVDRYLKLIDFGIATCVHNDMTSVMKEVPEGSFNYVSPEALKNVSSSNVDSPSYGRAKYKVGFKSDVWSLGCILYQMVYRKTPFQHVVQMWAKYATIIDPDHEIVYPNADWVPQKIISTIKRCLQYDTRCRPSVDELITEYEDIFLGL